MIDPQHNWRLLSESFDRRLSDEEQSLLDKFLVEHESQRRFVQLFERVRDCASHQGAIIETGSSLNQHLSEEKKNELQRLVESAMADQQVPLTNRDVVFACELVSQGAISLGEFTETISEWNSDSVSLSTFLRGESSVTDANFSKIESHISATVFSQTLELTLVDEVVTAIKERFPRGGCTVFDGTSDDFSSVEFVNLLDRTISGEIGDFELLLDRLIDESRSVILQSRRFRDSLRLKPVVDEVTMRLVGRKKLEQGQLRCYYRNVGIAMRRLLESDPELSGSFMPSIGGQRVAVNQIVDCLNQLPGDESRFVLMFNLRFFAGLTAPQVASLLNVTEQDVSVECGYGIARLFQLINE